MESEPRKVRILVYSQNFAPEQTGIGKYSGDMAKWFHDRGHEVSVIASPPHYPEWLVANGYARKLWHRELYQGVLVHRVPVYVPSAQKLSATGRILLESSFALFSLRWWIPLLLDQRRFDVVVAITPPLQSGFMPYLYGRLRKVPWVLHIQDLQVDAAVRLGMLKKSRLTNFLFNIEKFLLRRAARVSTITEAMGARAMQKGAMNTIHFPNWSDTRYIHPLPSDNALRHKLRVSADDILVLYSGNMGEKQGLEIVLKAAELLKSRPKLMFLLVGAGAARSRLELKARALGLSNVRFLDLVAWEELPQLLAAGDIHLVVQRRAAADLVMPSKLNNILAAGRPTVATADPGTSLFDVITQHDTGIAVPPEDVGAFVNALERLAGSAYERRRMGVNARRFAEQYLEKEAILKRFETALIELVGERQV